MKGVLFSLGYQSVHALITQSLPSASMPVGTEKRTKNVVSQVID
jgi:hypothetical protein